MKTTKKLFFDSSIIFDAVKRSFIKLNPLAQIRTPVIFVTYVAAIITTICTFARIEQGHHFTFNLQISCWLWFTVLFANFAEAFAESRGKAQAASLRKSQTETYGRLIVNNIETQVHSSELQRGDLVVCEANDIIPCDGEVVEGIATVDESAITGESAPVIRESGGDRSAVTVGTRVVSDRIVVNVTSEQGSSFLDHIISLIEGAKRQKTPNEIALTIILSGLTLIFLMVVVTLPFFAHYFEVDLQQDLSGIITVPILTGLFVCLIPTTISGLLNAIGIAGMDRLIHRNIIAKSGRSVEAAGDVDVLLLDKTGTITLGNRMATNFIPVPGVSESYLAEAAQLASLSDETPEGRSIVVLAKDKFQFRSESLPAQNSKFFPFSAFTRMSGIDIYDDLGKIKTSIRKGAVDAISEHITEVWPPEFQEKIHATTMLGETPLLVIENNKVLGLIVLRDIIKGGIKERFAELRRNGIRTIMVTGDNPLTAAAIAAEAGVDDFIAQATPEMKLERIKNEQNNGHLVAMAGDGTNDAPALAQADVGVAMNTGTQASREAGNMVDLDSNPTKLLEIVQIGKQLLMTRGALTTFSIANDVAKYFAILPALFGSLYLEKDTKLGPLAALNIMNLSSHHSAILSTVIFNALIIITLIPLAIKGVHYKAQNASSLLKNNLLLYGLGGLMCPFIFIKIIDFVISHLGII
jgi:potassium-transporting ATPase ATP-binding subunit